MIAHLARARQLVVGAPLIAATGGERLRSSVSSNYAIIGTTDDYPAIESAQLARFAVSRCEHNTETANEYFEGRSACRYSPRNRR